MQRKFSFVRVTMHWLCLFAIVTNPLVAKSFQPTPLTSLTGQEFVVGKNLGKPLIAVSVLNGVRNPGVYHVPADTDLGLLLSYAGGVTDNSDLESITLRRKESTSKSYTSQEINLASSLQLSQGLQDLQDQDLIMVSQKSSPERASVWVSILASIVSIGLSVALIEDINGRD